MDRKLKRKHVRFIRKHDKDYIANKNAYAGLPLPPEKDFTLLSDKNINIGKLILEKMSRDMKRKNAY